MSNLKNILLIYVIPLIFFIGVTVFWNKQSSPTQYDRLIDCANENHYAADNMHVSIHTAKDLSIEIEKSLFLTNLNDRKSMLDTFTAISKLNNNLQDSLDNDYYFDSCD